MSSTSLLPTRGAENTIYLAFASVLVAIWVNNTLPNLFERDPRAYITIVLVGASLVAGLLFYTKPERGVTLIIQKWLLQKGKKHSIFAARVLLLTRAWEWSVSEFPSLEKEAEYIVGTLSTDSTLHTDIWVIKGACYFAFTGYFLPILLILRPPYSFLLPLVIMCILVLSLRWRYKNFLNIIYMVLQMRYLEDRLRADGTARQVRSRLGYNLEESIAKLEVEYKRGLLIHLEDILQVLENRQWERFETRFRLLIESFESFTNVRLNEGYNDHIQTWGNALQEFNMFPEVDCWIRFKNERKVLTRLCDAIDFKSRSSLDKILKLKNVDNRMDFFRNTNPQNLDVEGIHTIAGLINMTANKPKDMKPLARALMRWISGSEYAMKLTLRILFEVPLRIQTPLLEEMGCLMQPSTMSMVYSIYHQGGYEESRMAARIIGSIREPAKISKAIVNLRSVAYRSSNVGIESLSAIFRLKQRIDDCKLDDWVLDTLKRHGGEKLFVAIHILETAILDTIETETIKQLLIKRLLDNTLIIRKKSAQSLSTLSKVDFHYPDIPREFIGKLLNIEYDKEEYPIPTDTVMKAFFSSPLSFKDTYIARILSGSEVDGAFTYSDIAKLLTDDHNHVKIIGLLMLRDEQIEGEIPTDLPGKVIDFLGQDKPLLGKLAASTIGIRQDIMMKPFIRHVRTHNPYTNLDVVLALGCLGTKLADYPDIILKSLDQIGAGYNELDLFLFNVLGNLSERALEYPNVIAFLEKHLGNSELSGLKLVSLFETSRAILDSRSLATLTSRVEKLKSPWIYDVGMATITDIEERTSNLIN